LLGPISNQELHMIIELMYVVEELKQSLEPLWCM